MPGPKITRRDILEGNKGMLQKQLYVVLTSPTNGLEAVLDNLEAHLEYQVRMEKEGNYFASGPFFAENEEDWEGEGMFVVRAGSLSEAKAIADADPMHQSGARSYRCKPWLINEGTLTITLRYSDVGYDLV
jgi:uncharacterized protein YciI